MVIEIVREINGKKFSYKTTSDDTLIGTTDYVSNFLLKKILVVSERYTLQLKETNVFLKLLNSLPILNCETFTRFKLYVNGNACGYTKNIFFRPAFYIVIENDCFELRLHSGSKVSLMKNGEQIALYKKSLVSMGEKHLYRVEYLEQKAEMEQIMLFCVFVDVMFYKNHMSLSYYKYENDYVINDKYKERAEWSLSNQA